MDHTLNEHGKSSSSETEKPNGPTGDAEDPFASLEKLTISQDFAQLDMKKKLIRVPVDKPDRNTFFRCHPAPQFQGIFPILRTEERDYLVMPELAALLPGDVVPRLLRLCITRQGTTRVWPIGVPDEHGRDNSWHASARAAAQAAEKEWVRIVANREVRGYDVFAVSVSVPNPDWPDMPFKDILRIAFNNDGLVDREDHPALRQLRGEI